MHGDNEPPASTGQAVRGGLEPVNPSVAPTPVSAGVSGEAVTDPTGVASLRIHRRRLPDEEYEEQLEAIINRDFFPSVKRSRKDKESSTQSSDLHRHGLSSAARIPSTDVDASFTPVGGMAIARDASGFALPSAPEAASEALGATRVSELSLDQFQATHATEDDFSFERLMEEIIREQRQKKQWMYRTSLEHNRRQLALRRHLEDATEPQQIQEGMLIRGSQALAIEDRAHGTLLSNPHVVQSNLIFHPPTAKEPRDERREAFAIAVSDLQRLAAIADVPGRKDRIDAAQLAISESYSIVPSPEAAGTLVVNPDGADEPSIKAVVAHTNTRFAHEDEAVHLWQQTAPVDQLIGERQRLQMEMVRRAREADEALQLGDFHDQPGALRTPMITPETAPRPIMTWGVIGATPAELPDLHCEKPSSSTVRYSAQPEVPSTAGPDDNSIFTIQDQSRREETAERLRAAAVQKSRSKRRHTSQLKDEIQMMKVQLNYSKTPTPANALEVQRQRTALGILATGGGTMTGSSGHRRRITGASSSLATPRSIFGATATGSGAALPTPLQAAVAKQRRSASLSKGKPNVG